MCGLEPGHGVGGANVLAAGRPAVVAAQEQQQLWYDAGQEVAGCKLPVAPCREAEGLCASTRHADRRSAGASSRRPALTSCTSRLSNSIKDAGTAETCHPLHAFAA
jgi:hypothetical protein